MFQKRNKIEMYRVWFFSFLAAMTYQTAYAQCPETIGCVDCYSWCENVTHQCDAVPLLKQYCRISCKVCVETSDACARANCSQRCILSSDTQSASCLCNENYRMLEDGRTCEDINECEENATICSDAESPYCVNKDGWYSCQSCSVTDQAWNNYYNRNDCCKRQNEQCGESTTNNGRIVGGKNALSAAWPWMTYIQNGNFICGGSLISNIWVVTAAHCFPRNITRQTIVLTAVYNTSDATSVHHQTRYVAQIVVHPGYSFPNNDIALLELDRPVAYGDFVKPVCLPNGEAPAEGEICYATGYGATSFRGSVPEILQEVDLPIASLTRCVAAFSKERNQVDPDTMICAGYEMGGKDACQGDSGGPLVCQRCKNCNWYLAGITSFGKGCAKAGFFGVYTSVRMFESWIAQHTQISVRKEKCVKPSWTIWSAWSECSATCNQAIKTRTRNCQNGVIGDPGCHGIHEDFKNCTQISCSRWTEFGNATSCSQSCGGGKKTLTRSCVGGNPGDIGCEGPSTTTMVCNVHMCPIWSEWTWGECSATCGGGTQSRTRRCINFGVSGSTCIGNESEIMECNTDSCPGWSSWEQTGVCSVTCGGGTIQKTRQCIHRNDDYNECLGIATKFVSCQMPACPTWGPWSEFSACDVTCGEGKSTKTRTCVGGTPGQGFCLGSSTETRKCDKGKCIPCVGLINAIRSENPELTCRQYAERDYCTTYNGYMKQNCALACCMMLHDIFPEQICSDSSPTHACLQYQLYCYVPTFRKNCRRTCRDC